LEGLQPSFPSFLLPSAPPPWPSSSFSLKASTSSSSHRHHR
jgi:hypothetical protein